MSEKRFIEESDYVMGYREGHCIYDKVQRKYLYLDEVKELLNSLAEENERLIEKRGELETKNVILKKENEQLRKELKQRHDNKHELGRLIDINNKQKLQIEELEKTKERWIEKTDKLEQYIDSLFWGNTHICKHLDVEMVKFWCDKEQKYHIPHCKYKDCFKKENLVKTADEVLRSVDDE